VDYEKSESCKTAGFFDSDLEFCLVYSGSKVRPVLKSDEREIDVRVIGKIGYFYLLKSVLLLLDLRGL
jgi:hypothetical protein